MFYSCYGVIPLSTDYIDYLTITYLLNKTVVRDLFCQVSLATVGHVLIFLGHTSVSVISGLQAKTVRLISMNAAVATNVVSIWAHRVVVVALTSMLPVTLVQTQTAKDLSVSVEMALQVLENRKLIASI